VTLVTGCSHQTSFGRKISWGSRKVSMFRSIRVLSKVARAGGISGEGGRAAGHTSLCPKAPLLPDEDECFITELLDGRNTPTASCPATQAGIDMSDRWKTMLRREHQRSMSMEARAVPNSRARQNRRVHHVTPSFAKCRRKRTLTPRWLEAKRSDATRK
jgi:hypothetical protein